MSIELNVIMYSVWSLVSLTFGLLRCARKPFPETRRFAQPIRRVRTVGESFIQALLPLRLRFAETNL